MYVMVDGIVYGHQRYGGINTYLNQVLPRVARYPHTHVDLLVPARCMGVPPGPPVRHLPRDFLPTRTGLSWRLDQRIEPLLESLKLALFGLRAKAKPEAVFHSSYFTSVPISIPHVAIVHDMNHELFPDAYTDPAGVWLRKRYPEYLRRATRIIAVSATTKKHAVEHYGLTPDTIEVIYHAVDTTTFYPDRKDLHVESLRNTLGIRLPYVLYVGGRWHYKNFGVVLEATSQLFHRTGLSLVVAGPPWSQRERAEIPAHPAAPALHLVEHPDDGLLRVLYGFATAFIFPSLHEGFGIPLLEAMACGAPVIAADTPIFREIADTAALYFDPYDPCDLVRAVERCLDERTNQEYRNRGLVHVARYSWDRTAAETYATYERAVQQDRGSH
jgi:glycosyltransferase involved in cell wall biosynthesis